MKNPFRVSGSEPDTISPERAESSEKSAAGTDVAAAKEDLKKFKRAHELDPNLPEKEIEAINHALQHGDAEEVVHADHLLLENSPYEEVRAAVRTDDNGEVANTVRAWILGMIFVTVGSGLNMFLSMRYGVLQHTSDCIILIINSREPVN